MSTELRRRISVWWSSNVAFVTPGYVVPLLAFVLLIHFLVLQGLFPFNEIFTDHPIMTVDFPLHYYFVNTVSRFLHNEAHIWGYDPFFMAGYPASTTFDSSTKGWEMFVYLLSMVGMESVVAFKLWTYLAFFCVPLLIFGAARNLGLSREVALVAALLAVSYWHLSRVRVYSSGGVISFFSQVVFLAPYVFSVFYKYLGTSNLRNWALLVLSASLLFWIHILGPLVAFVPILILYIARFRRIPIKVHLALAAGGLVVLLLNSAWLIPFIQYHANITTALPFLQQGTFRRLIKDYLDVTAESNIRLFLLLFSGIGLYVWRRQREKLLVIGGTFGIYSLLTYSSQFTHVTDMIEPYRFFACADAFLLFPSAVGVYEVGSRFLTRESLSLELRFGFLALGALALPVYLYSIRREIPKWEMAFGLSSENQAMINWLENDTSPDGRILFESEDPRDVAILPLYVRREFIGGPYRWMNVIHHFAEFAEGILFEKDIQTLDQPTLEAYFDLYNITHVVCYSDKAKQRLAQMPDYLTQVGTIGRYALFRAHRQPSYFYQGTGMVIADYNRLSFENASPGDVIIKYHWLDTFQTNPPLRMEPVYLMDDPIPFIRVLDAPSTFEIVNTY